MHGLIELIAVLAFGIGWGVIELMSRHLERQRKARSAASREAKPQPD